MEVIPDAARDSSNQAPPARGRFKVLYDDQCEICQACISWLQMLDRRMVTEPLAIHERVSELHPSLTLQSCLEQLHVVDPNGKIYRGWNAVARLARLFPVTWPIGAIGSIPPFRWVFGAIYRFVASNRYALSKCRGGACRSYRPTQVRRKTSFRAFWSCYCTGMLLRFPLIAFSGIRDLSRQAFVFLKSFRRRIDLLQGKLSILFLGGVPTDIVPILFGELFTAILYDGVFIDPGSPRMRRSLAKHLKKLQRMKPVAIVATHHHEEHVGNLTWLSERLNVPVYAGAETLKLLQPPAKIPWVRRLFIGQPPLLECAVRHLGTTLQTEQSDLVVLPAPGHCDDHVVLYDPKEKVLLAGDAFMGSYFSTPNPDVDSLKWMTTLERLMTLDIDVLIEGHGHIHTLRPDFPDLPGVIFRHDPKAQIEEKLRFFVWLRQQIESGFQEGLSPRAIEASCFPWKMRWSWENFFASEMIRVLSLGHFSKSELIRSFVRDPQSKEALPKIYQVRFLG